MNVPDPSRTYALVVGIEKYDNCRNLDGPALNALNFAHWLSERGVPNKNIFLFISELEANTESVTDFLSSNLENLKKQTATRENIDQALFSTICKQEEGNLLYIYWVGHGYIINIEERMLSYSDDSKSFNLSCLLKSLKTDTFGNFDSQILLIDACSKYAKSTSKVQYFGEKPRKEGYRIGPVKNQRKQFVLFSTQEGYPAINKDREKTALFSDELLKQLSNEEQLLIPEEFKRIAESIQTTFKNNHYNKLTPIYLWTRDADGNEERLPLTKDGHKYLILEEKWENLKSILAKIDRYILYVCCYLVLSNYSKDVDGNYSEINLLKSESSSEEEILNSLNKIFYKIIKNPENEENKEPIFIVIKFVSYLLYILPNHEETRNSLNQCKEEISNELNKNGISVKNIKQEITDEIRKHKEDYKEFNPYLIIVYKPKSSKNFYLSAELIFQKDNDKPNLRFSLTDETVATSTNIQDKFDNFLLFSYKIIRLYGFTDEQLIIEMFLPIQQLAESSEKSYEKIKINIGVDSQKWVSGHHKFVLRSFERITDDHINLSTIKKKWDRFNALNSNEEEIDKRFKWIYCQEDCKYSQYNSNILGINLLSSLEINRIELLRQTILEGLPFFIWNRDICGEREKLKQEFIKCYLNNLRNLDSLLETIKNQRSQAYQNYIQDQRQDGLGYHLGFLCDNPYRLPSSYENEYNNALLFPKE